MVYTYGLQLKKLFSDGEGDPQKAGFVLYNSTDGYYLQAGAYRDHRREEGLLHHRENR